MPALCLWRILCQKICTDMESWCMSRAPAMRMTIGLQITSISGSVSFRMKLQRWH